MNPVLLPEFVATLQLVKFAVELPQNVTVPLALLFSPRMQAGPAANTVAVIADVLARANS